MHVYLSPLFRYKPVLVLGCKYLSLYRSEILGNRLHLENLSKLRYLDLTGCGNLSTEDIGEILGACQSLERLTLDHAELSHNMVEEILCNHSGKTLEILSLFHCKKK